MAASFGIRSIMSFALLALLALSASAAEPAGKADLPELVIGDAYHVLLAGQTSDEVSEYVVLKQMDEWIVFGGMQSCGRGSECNAAYGFSCELINNVNPFGPRLEPEKVPLLGKWLTKKTVPYFQKNYLWLPRANIKQLEHFGGADVSINAGVFKGDSPSLAGDTIPPEDTRYYFAVIEKAKKPTDVTVVALSPGEISFRSAGVPTKLSLADVDSIHQVMPFDYLKYKAEQERKQAAK